MSFSCVCDHGETHSAAYSDEARTHAAVTRVSLPHHLPSAVLCLVAFPLPTEPVNFFFLLVFAGDSHVERLRRDGCLYWRRFRCPRSMKIWFPTSNSTDLFFFSLRLRLSINVLSPLVVCRLCQVAPIASAITKWMQQRGQDSPAL